MRSNEDIPPHCRSTVDGYAVLAKDTFGASESLPAILQVVEDIPMGSLPRRKLTAGLASKIPTGGILPDGADACVMIEHTESLLDGTVLIMKPVSPGENVIQKGEDVSAGSLLLPRGSRLRPPDVGALAALGVCQVRQKGSGTRILLDFALRAKGIDGTQISGYEREEYTHTQVATP